MNFFMPINPSDIPKTLRALRTRAGLGQDELARAVGYKKQSSISDYETKLRRRYVNVDVAERLANVLIGKGTPPITRQEVMDLAGVTVPPSSSQVGAISEAELASVAATTEAMLSALGYSPAEVRHYSTLSRDIYSGVFKPAVEGAGMSANNPTLRAQAESLIRSRSQAIGQDTETNG